MTLRHVSDNNLPAEKNTKNEVVARGGNWGYEAKKRGGGSPARSKTQDIKRKMALENRESGRESQNWRGKNEKRKEKNRRILTVEK